MRAFNLRKSKESIKKRKSGYIINRIHFDSGVFYVGYTYKNYHIISIDNLDKIKISDKKIEKLKSKYEKLIRTAEKMISKVLSENKIQCGVVKYKDDFWKTNTVKWINDNDVLLSLIIQDKRILNPKLKSVSIELFSFDRIFDDVMRFCSYKGLIRTVEVLKNEIQSREIL